MKRRKAFRLFCVSNFYSDPTHCRELKNDLMDLPIIFKLVSHFYSWVTLFTFFWVSPLPYPYVTPLALPHPCMASPLTLTLHDIMRKICARLHNILHFKRDAVFPPNYHHSLHASDFPARTLDILLPLCNVMWMTGCTAGCCEVSLVTGRCSVASWLLIFQVAPWWYFCSPLLHLYTSYKSSISLFSFHPFLPATIQYLSLDVSTVSKPTSLCVIHIPCSSCLAE